MSPLGKGGITLKQSKNDNLIFGEFFALRLALKTGQLELV